MLRYKFINLEVVSIHQDTPDIKTFTLKDAENWDLPPFTPGSHIYVHRSEFESRPYSLSNGPAENKLYRISVKRVEDGEVSPWLHDEVKLGDIVLVSLPSNNFKFESGAAHSIFIAGGIGITPIMSMLDTVSHPHEFFYLARSPEHAAFYDDLRSKAGEHPRSFHFSAEQGKTDIRSLLARAGPQTHVYCCGPAPLMDAVVEACQEKGLPADQIHVELFKPLRSGGAEAAFTLRLKKSGREIVVDQGNNAVRALRAAGINLQASCMGGICGRCVTTYTDGSPIHHDQILSAEERKSQVALCVCSAEGVLELDM
ncbi:PDR/VanB family oxidoreductase [Agrobacterium larrymoorei]|uniref:PDR/VanB family oxidoreductase n=1 Tax=Agrobacterium larrymoorei TaxID=160699 RepID=A0AAF0KFY7_9HYPH|nr:PDR/VanB family oxidoreductase [Agrobacterium larrymoorei]WHA42612.1 PDR/VanB family oxidoreductase [Agrobacterium larrymoorei]